MRGSEFAELQAFVAVAEERSFRRAAERLRMTPSSLSQTIRALEERLGVRLLHRTTRSVSPTEAGARLYARFAPAMAEMNEAVADARARQGEIAGTVRLHAPRQAVAMFVEPGLGRFSAAHPEIVLDVTIDDALSDIVHGGFDAGIRLGELLEEDMVAVPLGPPLRQLAVASPEYVARWGRPRTPAELLHHRCINWRQPGQRGLYRWEFARRGQWFGVAVSGPLVVSSRDLAVSAAIQGVGIAFWAEPMLRPHIDAGVLVPLLDEYSAPFPGWHLYYSKQRATPAPLRVLADHLRAEARRLVGEKERRPPR